MHSAVGKSIAYVGRTLFGAIMFILLIGIIKFHGDIGGYISFLNTKDRSTMQSISQTFRGNDVPQALTGINLLSGTQTSGTLLQESGSGITGLDAYDPSLESDMNTETASGFGFSAPQDSQTPQDQSSPPPPKNDKQQLINLIKNRESQTQQTP